MLDSILTAMGGTPSRELEARLTRLERQFDLLLEVLGAELPSPEPDPAIAAAIQRRIDAGQKIEAIKKVREASGCGLKEAKDAVELNTWRELIAFADRRRG